MTEIKRIDWLKIIAIAATGITSMVLANHFLRKQNTDIECPSLDDTSHFPTPSAPPLQRSLSWPTISPRTWTILGVKHVN